MSSHGPKHALFLFADPTGELAPADQPVNAWTQLLPGGALD